jgi:hypothetical protein
LGLSKKLHFFQLNLRTGMAVFKFNEASFKTRQKLRVKDFICHLELETYPGHFFHVYIDEMNLVSTSSNSFLLHY